jgi:hypothetical protein
MLEDLMTTEEKTTIEKFDKELNAAWDAIKPEMTGRLFPEAQAIIKVKLSKWLHESQTIRDATLLLPDGFDGFHKNPEWSITCDYSNNPPVEQAKGRIHVTVFAKLFQHIIRHELKRDGLAS